MLYCIQSSVIVRHSIIILQKKCNKNLDTTFTVKSKMKIVEWTLMKSVNVNVR